MARAARTKRPKRRASPGKLKPPTRAKRRTGSGPGKSKPKTTSPKPELRSSVADQVEQEQLVAAIKKRQAGERLSKAEISAIRRFEQRRDDEKRDEILRRVPQRVLCELLATDRRAILNWEADGMPFAADGRLKFYDLYVVLAWLKKRWLTGDGGAGAGGMPSKRTAEIKLMVRREAAIQLNMQIKSGQLRDRNEVEAENAQKVTAVRAALESLRRALAPAVLELGDDASIEDAEALIWDYIGPLLETFARKKS